MLSRRRLAFLAILAAFLVAVVLFNAGENYFAPLPLSRASALTVSKEANATAAGAGNNATAAVAPTASPEAAAGEPAAGTSESGSGSGASRPRRPLPPLSSILDDDGKVVGDPQPWLDYAVVGFGKCGTTTLSTWLKSHGSEVLVVRGEDYSMALDRPEVVLKKLDALANSTDDRLRGFKSPLDGRFPVALRNYRNRFPKTKLLVGIRHPVLHYESLYNFKARTDDFPNANDILGNCVDKRSRQACPTMSFFGRFLLQFGKHLYPGRNATDDAETRELEDALVRGGAVEGMGRGASPGEVGYMPNDVFVADVTQLKAGENATRDAEFRAALSDFLGLESEIPRQPVCVGCTHLTNKTKRMYICDEEYDHLREVLMKVARLSSRWIRTVFLHQPGVYYHPHIFKALEGWMYDPCVDEEWAGEAVVDRQRLRRPGK